MYFLYNNVFSKLSKRSYSLEKNSKMHISYRNICRKKATFEYSQQSMGQTVNKSTKCGIYCQELELKSFQIISSIQRFIALFKLN